LEDRHVHRYPNISHKICILEKKFPTRRNPPFQTYPIIPAVDLLNGCHNGWIWGLLPNFDRVEWVGH